MKDVTIGILGGMGTYATIHIFDEYAKIFPAEKEWERPRIVIDNRCTMPSRVRAYLYNENREQLVNEMLDSLESLLAMGCNKIILACNTSHLFLDEIYERKPELKYHIVNIIQECSKSIQDSGVKEVWLLASEGTIDSHIYQDALELLGVKCIVPSQEVYTVLRDCIEAVKQDEYSEDIEKKFLDLVNQHENCILGCTELPVLYKKYASKVVVEKVFDPMRIALGVIKEEVACTD